MPVSSNVRPQDPHNMDSYTLTIQTLAEIRSKLSHPTEYNATGISALVRKLLFDKHQLLAAAQKVSGRRFVIHMRQAGFDYDAQNASKGVLICQFRCLEPGTEQHASVSIDEYGGLNVLMTQQTPISIKQVIKYVANKRGGVHYDPNSLDDDEELMNALSKSFYNGNVLVFG